MSGNYMLRADATDDDLQIPVRHSSRDITIHGSLGRSDCHFAVWCDLCGKCLTSGEWMYWHHAQEIVDRHLNA